jgi:hypothetical protein
VCGCQVVYSGQPIAAIVAETKDEAQRAAKMVKVTYEDLPAIITIEVNNLVLNLLYQRNYFYILSLRYSATAQYKYMTTFNVFAYFWHVILAVKRTHSSEELQELSVFVQIWHKVLL